ncbi:MAG: hypothetical protein QNJ18_08320 [Xenococcaceae cyanobacterium MO_167.B52]|nr:hypothetical protein [Xenococcaceae cyanobacterium MO_167.B52]
MPDLFSDRLVQAQHPRVREKGYSGSHSYGVHPMNDEQSTIS